MGEYLSKVIFTMGWSFSTKTASPIVSGYTSERHCGGYKIGPILGYDTDIRHRHLIVPAVVSGWYISSIPRIDSFSFEFCFKPSV